MKRFTLSCMALSCLIGGRMASAQSADTINVIQTAEINRLKQQVLELQTKDAGTDRILASLRQEIATLKSQAAAAQKTGEQGLNLATTAQKIANQGVSAANAAQTAANQASRLANLAQGTANIASNKAGNPVVMVGAESGRRWMECPDGYHWIGGFNEDTGVAYPEVNRWHGNVTWLCARN